MGSSDIQCAVHVDGNKYEWKDFYFIIRFRFRSEWMYLNYVRIKVAFILKAPPSSCHLFVGEQKTVNWLLKCTVVVFQICRFCWHRIRTDENGLCPACRKVSTIFFPYFTQKSYQWRASKNHFHFKNIFKNHSHGASSRNWRRNKYSAVVVVSWKNICVAFLFGSHISPRCRNVKHPHSSICARCRNVKHPHSSICTRCRNVKHRHSCICARCRNVKHPHSCICARCRNVKHPHSCICARCRNVKHPHSSICTRCRNVKHPHSCICARCRNVKHPHSCICARCRNVKHPHSCICARCRNVKHPHSCICARCRNVKHPHSSISTWCEFRQFS